MDKSSYSDIFGKIGVPKSTITHFLNVISHPLKCCPLKHLWDIMGVGKIKKIIVREVADKIVFKKKRGNKTYLLMDEEAYIVAKSEIDGSHLILRDIQTFDDDLQQVIN